MTTGIADNITDNNGLFRIKNRPFELGFKETILDAGLAGNYVDLSILN